MHAETADVLCLTGWHHDSRAEAPGPFPAGDMHFLRKDGTCGCGRPPAGCEVWTGILRAALSPQADLAGRFDRGQHAWQVLERGTGCARTRSHDGLVTLTYRAVAARAGTRIVVDTTRPPAPQPRPDGLRRFYVHLEREPQPRRRAIDQVGLTSSALSTAYWVGANLAAQAIAQEQEFLRYEDFVADPTGSVAALFDAPGGTKTRRFARPRTTTLATVTLARRLFHRG